MTSAQTTGPERILGHLTGYQITASVKAAIDLGVFDAIAAGRRDAAGVAADVGADERGVRLLLDALAAFGFLTTGSDGYSLAEDVDAFLVRGRPTYLGDTTDVFVSGWAWEGFGRLAEVVRAGGTVFADHGETPDHPFWEVFATANQGVSHPSAQGLAEVLAPWAARQDSLSVLDVACGGGLYAIAQGERHPDAQLTLMDWPTVLEHTRTTVEAAGMASRASYIGGDMFTADLGGPYDVVIASQVFHHFNEDRCVELMERMRAALRPGGLLAIHDFAALDDDPASEPMPRLFSLIMLVWTREGQAYSLPDYERMLQRAGFRAPAPHEIDGPPTRVLLAEAP
jgi:C-methyltransferase